MLTRLHPSRPILGLAMLLAGTVLAAGATAATLVVPDDHPTISAAIAASSPGDSILVRSGTYAENIVIPQELSLIGLAGGALPVIDGYLHPDSSAVEIRGPFRVLIRGFRITRGSGPVAGGIFARSGSDLWLEDSEIVGNGASCAAGGTGGVRAGLLHASHCAFSSNRGGWLHPGALWLGAGDLRDCTFMGNATGSHPECSGSAGAVEVGYGGAVVFERCHFIANQLGYYDAFATALVADGRVILRDCEFTYHDVAHEYAVAQLRGGPITIDACRFATNQVTNGGAILSVFADSVSIRGTSFVDTGGLIGAVVDLYGSEVEISECLFARNSTMYTSAGIVANSSDLVITRSTFVELESTGPPVLDARWGSVSMHRSIVAGTRGALAIRCSQGAVGDFDCNDIWDNTGGYEGCPPGPHDFSADPRFCDLVAGDYRLRADSPCAPPQSPQECDLVGAFGVGCGVVSVAQDASQTVASRPVRLAVDPNPVLSSRAVVAFELATEGPIALALFDAQGHSVRALIAGRRAAGRHTVEWNGLNDQGRRLPGGVYFLRLHTGRHTVSRKVVVLNR